MSQPPPPWSTRLAVGAVAFGVLAYEVTLTRVFSVLFRSPFVFLILSIAICGLGLGSWLAASPWRRRAREDDGEPAWVALAFAWLLPLPLVLLLTVGQRLVAEANGTAVALFTLLPYAAAGVFLSLAFARYADAAGRLYAFDLGGAALAAASTAALLSLGGGLAMPFYLGALAAAAALLSAWGRSRAASAAAVVTLVALLALGGAQTRREWLRLPAVTSQDAARVKPLFCELADPSAGSRMLYTRWSPVARTDVVSNQGTDTLYIWTDGDVPTQMEPFDGNLDHVRGYAGFIGFVPFALQPQPERVLCIGPGGGLDVLLALVGGARHIEPVEINPAMVPITERFKGFYGDLYHRPELPRGLIIDEGRSYLSRSPSRYDVIYFALAKSATTQQGGMALVDNYLYTREAFDSYFSHLQPGGLLALVLQEPHLTDRCLVTAVAAMLERGWTGAQIARRVAWLAWPPDLAPGPYRQLLLIRNGDFSDEQVQRLGQLAKERRLTALLTPGERPPDPYDSLLAPGLTAERFAAAVAGKDGYLTRLYFGGPWERLKFSVVTDDRPFYADMSPRLHPFLQTLLTASLLAGALCLLAGWLAAWRAGSPVGPAAAEAGYFGLLGVGFMLVEVALVQKLVLLLGYPTLSLTVILFSLLLGGAAGGWAANRGSAGAAARRLPVVVGALVVLLAGLAIGLDSVVTAVLPGRLAVRIAVAVAVLLPLGALLGQPFPTGLRRLGAARPQQVPVAWAVNGVLSVTGSVMAAALAARAGYRSVLLAGMVVYLLVPLVARGWDPVGRAEGIGAAASNGQPRNRGEDCE